jgi:hypothetical protein
MIRHLHNPGFPVRIDARDLESPFFESMLKLRIQSVAAGKLLGRFLSPIRPMDKRARHKLYRLSFPGRRTGQSADQKCVRIRCRFFVLRILDSQDVSCILYQSMLKSTSGTHERPPLFTGESDPLERPVHALVRTAGGAPEGMKLLQ